MPNHCVIKECVLSFENTDKLLNKTNYSNKQMTSNYASCNSDRL